MVNEMERVVEDHLKVKPSPLMLAVQNLQQRQVGIRKKGKLWERKEVEGEEKVMRRKLTKKKKDPLGRDVADKLDMLIGQYGSKYKVSGKQDWRCAGLYLEIEAISLGWDHKAKDT
ncbi:hypothetical protein TB2_005193 [Malus domestica]